MSDAEHKDAQEPAQPRMHTAGAPRIGSKRPEQRKRTPTIAELDTNPVSIGQRKSDTAKKNMLGAIVTPSQEPEAKSREKAARAPRRHDDTGALFHTGEWVAPESGSAAAERGERQIERHLTSVCYCLRPCCWLPATPVKRKREKEVRGKIIPEGPATSSTKEEQLITRYTGVCICYQCPCNGWKPTSTMPMIRMAR